MTTTAKQFSPERVPVLPACGEFSCEICMDGKSKQFYAVLSELSTDVCLLRTAYYPRIDGARQAMGFLVDRMARAVRRVGQ